MNKAELQKRQQMLSAVPTDQADDFEDIILTPSAPGVDKEKVVHLPISKTVEYSDEDFERATGRPQPFKVYTEDRMESLCKSIADIGVIDPITVRPLPDGTYQVLAGRHRRRASIRIGAPTIPAIIRSDISDYQAAMIMLDTNLERRAELSYSEKAYAYRMRMDLQHSRGRRTDLEGGQKVDTLGELGKENKDCTSFRKDLVDGTSISTIVASKIRPARAASGHTGIYLDKHSGKWIANINFRKKRYYLGRYDDINKAVNARKLGEQRLHDPMIMQYWDTLTPKKQREYLVHIQE